MRLVTLARASSPVPPSGLFGLRDRLGAMRASTGGDGDIAEALFAGLGSGSRWFLSFVHARCDCIHGHDNKEVNGESDQQERYDGVEKVPDQQRAGFDGREIRLTRHYSDQRHQEILRKRSDDGAESSANHHAYREVDDITAHDELPEA